MHFGWIMDSIFHEKQEGQLCAQHCLNNLLQGGYFTAVDLAKFATELDEAEKMTMAEGGFDTAEFIRFMEQPSSNMDDSGYFSVQVISKALSVWSLSIIPLTSPEMKSVVDIPTSQKAFICNHEHHWFTIRKLGRQWFNLDSLQRQPKLISDTYLKLFLTQLQLEGYSIFVVMGTLPDCEADQLLSLVPAVSSHRTSPKKKEQKDKSHATSRERDEEDEYAFELAAAMSASMSSPPPAEEVSGLSKDYTSGSAGMGGELEEREDVELTAAIYASMEDQETSSHDTKKATQDGQKVLSVEEIRQKRLHHFEGGHSS